jgi:hypothetical protein
MPDRCVARLPKRTNSENGIRPGERKPFPSSNARRIVALLSEGRLMSDRKFMAAVFAVAFFGSILGNVIAYLVTR